MRAIHEVWSIVCQTVLTILRDGLRGMFVHLESGEVPEFLFEHDQLPARNADLHVAAVLKLAKESRNLPMPIRNPSASTPGFIFVGAIINQVHLFLSVFILSVDHAVFV